MAYGRGNGCRKTNLWVTDPGTPLSSVLTAPFLAGRSFHCLRSLSAQPQFAGHCGCALRVISLGLLRYLVGGLRRGRTIDAAGVIGGDNNVVRQSADQI
jgi:hypothetical protein